MERLPREARERLAEEVEQTRHRNRTPPCPGRAVSWPRSSAMTRRRMLSTISRSCVATSTVVPVRLMRSSRSMMPREVWGSRLPVGSSHTRSGGRFTMARAMETRCCSPPESWSGRLVELLLQADQAQDLGDLRLDDVAALADDLKRERDVLEDGLVRQQLEVLEHAADVAAQVRHAPVAHGRKVLARDVDMALRRLHLADEHADEGGLARARMTHQEDELAGVDLQRDIRQGGLGWAGRDTLWSHGRT